MHTEVYAKRRRSAQTEEIIPIIDAENYFTLLPEHFVEITKQWLSHLATQQISGNGLRILTSIFRHTVGFNKFEDDMSGTRLKQISLIRSDHANHTLRLLAADHAVISRKGVYGRIVSINFDFASWGKMQKETNTPKIPKLVKDPRYLLPSRYRDEPVDTGNIIGAEPSETLAEDPSLPSTEQADTYANPHSNTAPANPTETVRQVDNSAIQSGTDNTEMANTVHKTAQIMEKLLGKLEQLESRFDTLQQAKPKNTSISTAPFCRSINTDDNCAQTLSDRIAPENQQTQIRFINCANQIDNVFKSQPMDIETAENISTQQDALSKQPSVATTYNIFKPVSKQQQPVAAKHHIFKPLPTASHNIAVNTAASTVENTAANTTKNTEIQVTQDTTSLKNSASMDTDLNYPDSLNQHTRKVLSGLLKKSHSHAQDILDLLALRLENTRNPINDIVLYCSSLVRKARSNTLDLDALNAYRASKKSAPSAKEQQVQALRQEYQTAHAEYQHFERINKMQANSYQCSVEEYLEQSGMKKSWDNIVERLEQVKYNIEQLS